MNYDWSTFTQKIRIKASVQTIYKAWTTRKGLESWFLRSSELKDESGRVLDADEMVSAGGTYTWLWHGYPDSVVETGEFLETNGNNRLQFDFNKAGIVTVEITDEGDNVSMMTITQSGIPTDDVGKSNYHVGCSTGWTFYRANLKSILEGGIDLRNIGYDNESND